MTYDLDWTVVHRQGPGSGVYGESPSGRIPRPRQAVPDAVGTAAVPNPPAPAVARRAGPVWPLVADDMFRLAHRDNTGAPLLDSHVAGLGLAAALLGELMLTDHLTIQDALVVVTDPSAPLDALAHTVLDRLTAEAGTHPVRTWLAYLGRTAVPEVAGRLERAGHLRTKMSRRLFASAVRYVPTNMNTAALPWARLSNTLRRGLPLEDADVLLGGLMVATDLHRVVLIGEATAFAAALRPWLDKVAYPIRELVTHTRAAAGDAVITKT